MMRLPKVHLASSMLLHNRKRLALSLGAMVFAVLIMFMEMGFFNGVNDCQSQLWALLKADLVMMNRTNIHLVRFGKMSRTTLQQVFAFPEVTEVIPVYKDVVALQNRKTKQNRLVFLLAFPPDSDPLNVQFTDGSRDELRKQGTILFDKKSRRIYGELNRGSDVLLNGRICRVGGFFEMGPNYSYDGNIIVGDGTWLQDKPPGEADRITYGLIRTKPGVDIQALRQRILKYLPDDTILLTPEELRQREVRYTISTYPIGAVFGVGLVIGFLVGVMICYQILYDEIVDHMPQYATLKAMGFPDRFLFRLVIRQALLLSIFGFLPGLAFAAVLYAVVQSVTGIPQFLTWARIAVILVLTIAMCITAGLIAVRKVTTADPAQVFR